MSNSMMIKITNNGTATTGGAVLAANQEGVFALHGNYVKYSTTAARAGLIDEVVIGSSTYSLAQGTGAATTVARIQLGNLGRNGQFYTVADSE